MKNLIEYILIHIVDNPDQVKIDVEEDEHGTNYLVSVHPEDMGRVIGKKGAVIQAIRTIARIRAVKEGLRINISIVEPETNAATAAQPADETEPVEETEPVDTSEAD